MKLGEMQRFKYIPRTHTIEGEYGGYFDRADDGDFVRFSDAQAKSLADERRIQELVEALQFAEAAIEAAREVYRIKGDLPGYELMGIALSKARAALRVGTK